ncbi:GNAT family N-acetyltransferase [Veronia nyctiphanis]|uniref:GNAT family N-acetyltransferase n=1 Tax=Veronia nyctiphanis TaxID=1278244 RepID=A0A4Q0YQE0_9GAMM|nr:GNAT family N-acetyltransferase [Veronia nyctiphanis]RXJ73242.1 GNAT family N-acetyltransferase [Veronia nyctiphanis]
MGNIQYFPAAKNCGAECEAVLRTLPEWFGCEDSLAEYVSEIDNMDTYTARECGRTVGFFTISEHFETSAELHVLGIEREYHRHGIGSHLLKNVEDALRSKGVKFLQVKTLSPKAGNADYALTMKFYLKHGFMALEDFDDLWGEDTPCRQLIKVL